MPLGYPDGINRLVRGCAPAGLCKGEAIKTLRQRMTIFSSQFFAEIFGSRSMRARFALLIGACGLAFALIVNTISEWRAESIIIEAARDRLGLTANAVARNLIADLVGRKNEVQALADLLASTDLDDAARTRQLLDHLQRRLPVYAWIGIANADGIVMAATQGVLEGRNVSQRPWFQQGLSGTYIGDPHEAVLLSQYLSEVGPGPLRLVDVTGVIATPDGAKAVLGAHLYWIWVENSVATTLGSLAPGSDVTVQILDAEGKRLFSTVQDTGPGNRLITARARFADLAESQVAKIDWSVVVEQSEANVLAMARQNLAWSYLLGAATALSLAVISWLLAQALSRSIVQLADQARRIDGAHGIRISNSTLRLEDEVGVLARTIDQLVERLQGQADRLQNFIRQAPVSIAMFDGELRYLACSLRWLDDFAIQRTDIVGHGHDEVSSRMPDGWRAAHARALAGETAGCDKDPIVQGDGQTQWLRWEIRPWYLPGEEVGGSVVFAEDITARILSEDQLRVTARVFEQAGEAIMVVDANGIIETVNAAFTRISGYEAEEAVGQRSALLQSGRHSAEFYKEMWDQITKQGFWQGEIWNRRKNGEIYPEWLSITRMDDDHGKVLHYVGVFADVTQLRESLRQVEQLATHDSLTGLPNRAVFQDRLQLAIAQMHRSRSRLALLFIDLDNFKTINDTLGHDIGDELLKQVAQRLRETVREIDTLARLGGDEFTSIISECSNQVAQHVAQRIVDSVSRPYTISDRKLFISASLGVAFYPEDASTASDLIKAADSAMYRAKELGRNRIEFFLPELHEKLLKRARIETALREALKEEDRLRLVFQPKVDLTVPRSRIVGAEALLRWRDPEMGNVSPGEFIPVAEACGQIRELDRRVQELLVRNIAQWQRSGLVVPTIAINVSPHSIGNPQLADGILALLAQHQLPNRCLQIEITEGALLDVDQGVFANLNKLAEAGIGVAIDDFGTGYSSLSYLKRLPLQELKIDKSFVDGLGTQKEDEAITGAIRALASSLNLRTVAEGVETERQRAWLADAGCQIAQGYHFFSPLEAPAFAELLAQQQDPEA